MDASRPKAREILESAFDDAFSTPPELPQETVVPQPTIPQTASEASAESSLEDSTSADDGIWKEEYESHLQAWRAQSAEQREKAENERLKWETIRAQEREEADRRKSAGGLSVQESWEKLGASGSSVASTTASSQAVEDPTRAEPSTKEGTPDDIHKWENVPSIDSSFPSILPDTPLAPSEPPAQKSPISATLSIFDSSLSTRTRVLVFASSLAINLVLPFINGVMLGFGEIFARRVVTEWFGWKIPAINVGLGKSSLGRQSIFS